MLDIRISIIIPVYNSKKYLVECLDSIISQNFKEVEVICIDDGADFEEVSILDEYSSKDSRIKVLHQNHAGASKARNNGIYHAKGDIIWFVDSDDLINPGSLEIIYGLMKNGNLDLLMFGISTIGDDDSLTQKFRNYYEKKGDYLNQQLEGKALLTSLVNNREYSISACIYSVRREFLIKDQLFFEDDILNEDAIHMPLCLLRAKRACCIDKKLYTYRIRSDSSSKCFFSRKRLDSLTMMLGLMISEIERYRKEEDVSNALCQIARKFYHEIRRVEATLTDNETRDFPELSQLDILYKVLSIGPYKDRTIDLELYKYGLIGRIKEASQVYLYGADEWAQKAFDFLKKLDLDNNIRGFLVSEYNNDRELIGLPIYSIHEKADSILKNNALIFLTADFDSQKDILDTCTQHNISNVIKLDWMIKKMIIQGCMNN
jgi:glycosyltransferase involved in cell wall biosynthesis